MNIVYIIGNGFDMNLNLKTSYRDFYNYFKTQFPEDTLIADVKKNLDSETWADLEVALGKYTAKFSSTSDFQDVYFKISDKLSEYIRLEETKLKITEERKQKLCDDFIKPEQYFRQDYGKNISEYTSQFQSYKDWNITIINFNYSRTIENLLDFKTETTLSIGKNIYGKNVIISRIIHVHGIVDLNEPILLGVNDASQIENEAFKTDNDFLDILVKPQANKGLGDGIDVDCINALKNAHLICIFGSSIGETDKMWWELLGAQIKREPCRVIYFVKEKEIIPGNRRQLLPKKIRECQERILLITNLTTPQEKEQLTNKIWVGHNTDMFKLN
jgi:hypothetical protein